MKPLTPQNVLQIKGAKWIYEGRELLKGEIENLQSEAEIISNTQLWKMLINLGKYTAQFRAIEEAKTEKDLKQVQEFHKVVVLFEKFLYDISNKPLVV